jgi:tellurite methyltransferase
MSFQNRFDEKYKASPGLFGEEPMSLVKRALKYITSGKALELGVGNGRNTLFLLSNSFKVMGVDMSEEGIKILNKRAKDNSNLDLVVSDVLKFKTIEKFDLVLAIGLLHFLEKEDIDFLINKMKKWTAKEGLNVIATRMTQNNKQDLPHIFTDNELKNYYQDKDWKIEEYNEIEKEERKLASLIVRKL